MLSACSRRARDSSEGLHGEHPSSDQYTKVQDRNTKYQRTVAKFILHNACFRAKSIPKDKGLILAILWMKCQDLNYQIPYRIFYYMMSLSKPCSVEAISKRDLKYIICLKAVPYTVIQQLFAIVYVFSIHPLLLPFAVSCSEVALLCKCHSTTTIWMLHRSSFRRVSILYFKG